MLRLLVIIGATTALAGCQSQNPYALFGPNRVPAPGTAAPAPYYPANVGAAPATAPAAGASGRISVSADAAAPLAKTTTSAASSTDKESIRIVENPQPAIRTADSGAARSPGVSAPAAPSFSSPQPATNGKSSQAIRLDTNVAPAGYEQTSSTAGQWKAR